jgi:hypothetical protein
LRVVVAPPPVVVENVGISVQSAGVLTVGVAPAHWAVRITKSLLPRLSLAVVPVGSVGVTLVADALNACEPLR